MCPFWGEFYRLNRLAHKTRKRVLVRFFAENGKISFEDADSDKTVIVEDKSVNINSEMITKGLSVWFSCDAKYLGFSFNDYVYYAEAPEKFLNILNKYR